VHKNKKKFDIKSTVMFRINGTPCEYDQNWLYKITLHCLSFWSFIKKIAKNPRFHWGKIIESGRRSHYEMNVLLQNTLATIIGTPRIFTSKYLWSVMLTLAHQEDWKHESVPLWRFRSLNMRKHTWLLKNILVCLLRSDVLNTLMIPPLWGEHRRAERKWKKW